MKSQQARDRLVLAAALAIGGLSVLGAALTIHHYRDRRRLLLEGPRRVPKKPHKVRFGKVDGENRGPDPKALMDPPVEVEDPYFWLRDDSRKDPAVLSVIKEENKYTAVMTRHLKRLQKTLYQDMLKHLKQTDQEFPWGWGDYLYYSRTVEGKSYKYVCRRKGSLDAPEEIILDLNKLAKGHNYLDVGDWNPSPGEHRYLGYSTDTTGYETYDIKFKDLSTGQALPDVIKETSGSFGWGADASTVFYEKMDVAHRPYQLWVHVMGTPQEQDVMLFEEADERLWMGIHKTDSGRFLVVNLGGKQQNESWVLDLEGAKGGAEHLARKLQLIEKRRDNVRYSVEHWGEHFLILTNNFKGKEHINSMLVRAPLASPGAQHWTAVFKYDPSIQLKGLTCFSQHLVLHGRQGGFSQLWVYTPSPAKLAKGEAEPEAARVRIPHPEPVYCAYGGSNHNFEATTFRYHYTSLTSPKMTIDFDLKTGAKTVLKQVEVPHYDPSTLACERLEAASHDGCMVPISIVYSKKTFPNGCKGAPTDGPAKCLLYGYGSYGACIDPSFDSNRLALLERGVVFAIAHIRGGGEMGRAWYEVEGKFLTKRNTFLDFCACAEHLITSGVTAPDRLAISGGSAGGLLIGASVNMRPELFKCALADVPFTDVTVTMCDSSIPLTVVEWEEWGNPNEAKFHDYMRSYCPVSNVKEQPYPAILALAGLNDPRVAYWEPLKWVTKLREHKTDATPLLLKVDMGSGHFSASDRYRYLRERAFVYSFLLDQLGVKE